MDQTISAIQICGEQKHPRKTSSHIPYGTAGFRTRAEELDHVMFRMGVLAALRSKLKKGAIGLMITASHNPEPDNGIKLVDPFGEMLEQKWEELASKLANVMDNELGTMLHNIVEFEGIDLKNQSLVILGYDTRPSSYEFAKSATEGVEAACGIVNNFGVVTTPMLHYFVVCHNSNGAYGAPSEMGYYNKLSNAFLKLHNENLSNENYCPEIILDGANGVGALAVEKLKKYINKSLVIDVFNICGYLNHLCGADYVKVNQMPPTGVPIKENVRCVSLDGDADRIVYYYIDSSKKFHLLDGDRIATLIAAYLKEIVEESKLPIAVGLVQTAYSNGNSTRYIMDIMKIPVACVPTGVKHLHHKALDFDIGVYFEANGHGTIVFSNETQELINSAANNSSLPTVESEAARKLMLLMDVINQTVGDAISDMLLVETILQAKDWNIQDWERVYEDLPNRQYKISVQVNISGLLVVNLKKILRSKYYSEVAVVLSLIQTHR